MINIGIVSHKGTKMTITICCSAAFFKDAVEISKELKSLGHKTLLPGVAKEMAKSGDFDVEKYKTWHKNEKDFGKKTILVKKHIKEVEKADAILVINNRKHDIEGYIGGNTLIEMAIAFYLKKPVYLLHKAPDKKFMLYEEIMALNPIMINGNLRKIRR